MTATKILAAAVAIWSIILIAAGASFRDARHDALEPGPQRDFSKDNFKDDFDARWISSRKGDRLPSLAVANAQGEAAAPAASKPEQQLQVATEDDLRQAEEEHHRHRDICSHGRTWFTINQHRYWRCKL
jgi:hypothetical protein